MKAQAMCVNKNKRGLIGSLHPDGRQESLA